MIDFLRIYLKKINEGVDWLIVFLILPILVFGLVTMKNFYSETSGGDFFYKQLLWIGVGFLVFFIFSGINFSFLKRTEVLVFIYLANCLILFLLFLFGSISHGAKSWFDFGLFSYQPVDMMKLILVLVLAKYFSRRHVEIKYIKHILISFLYALIPLFLVLLQPDFGSAMVIGFIWLGMVLVSGISNKHLFIVFIASFLAIVFLWMFVFAPYQKARIMNFINPLADVHGTGYNAFQSMIAVGSGEFLGKGVGFGTQSRLKFLPEPQSDFIFASYSEEWGFVGSVLVIFLFGMIIWRILSSAVLGFLNFEILFSMGIAIFLMSHILVNIGMNLGLMPITGIPLPFMSYGGSHLLAEFAGLGIFMSMRRDRRSAHRDNIKNEFLGI